MRVTFLFCCHPCWFDVWGRCINIACYCHLVWHGGTTIFYPPVGSQCQYVNMLCTSQKLHSESKIIQFLFFVHYCKRSWHQKKNRVKPKTFSSHIKCQPRFMKSLSKHCERGGITSWVEERSNIFTPWSELMLVGRSCTVKLQATTLDTMQPRINGKLGKEQPD